MVGCPADAGGARQTDKFPLTDRCVKFEHRRTQNGAQPSVGEMKPPSKGVGQRVKNPQPGVVEGQPGHAGRLVNLPPHGNVPGVGGVEIGEADPERALGQRVGEGGGVGSGQGFEAVGDEVHPGVSDEVFGKLLEQ